MEVQIISKEILKPSSYTPHHLRTYKLSVLDQLAPPHYIPIILFYSPSSEYFCRKSDHLKKSFPKTLTHFYPFAGRIKDDFSINCNDDGAAFIEADVDTGEISMVLEQADINQLEQLLQCSPYGKSSKLSTDHICIWHAVADASTLATFANSWAAITSVSNNISNEVIFEGTTLFPPQDLSSFSLHNFVKEDELREIVMRRFLFDGSKVAALRAEDKYCNGCSRFAEENETATATAIYWKLLPSDNSKLAREKLHAGGGYFNFLKKAGEQARKSPNLRVFGFSSWCKFPFYEADFGWGKPIWSSPALKLNRVAIFLDTKDGKGIEAWIGLSKDDMVKFEKNPSILTYASFSPSM
ncbi:unnamed protein product [Dovyalis caffra]|uniref:BAHD acyltransferase At5g47980-like n=1 Tax=Dovyalis caffra TaxID=77055 RepID=A0AAV1S2U3_9ROSI|nr:unnamed protein product [Dovyalis caffra]